MEAVFIHEMGHVAQYQSGTNVILAAVPLQLAKMMGIFDPYISPETYRGTPSPAGLNVEAQADWHRWHWYCTTAGHC